MDLSEYTPQLRRTDWKLIHNRYNYLLNVCSYLTFHIISTVKVYDTMSKFSIFIPLILRLILFHFQLSKIFQLENNLLHSSYILSMQLPNHYHVWTILKGKSWCWSLILIKFQKQNSKCIFFICNNIT